jgi:hypothetical protein
VYTRSGREFKTEDRYTVKSVSRGRVEVVRVVQAAG